MSPPDQLSNTLAICNIPWMIQSSRVIKVEFNKFQNFGLFTYLKLLSRVHQESRFAFESRRIRTSERTLSAMVKTTSDNIQEISKRFAPGYFLGYQLGVLKLLYNCNVLPTSREATRLLEKLLKRPKLDQLLQNHYRLCVETLHTLSQKMETTHVRTLRQFHASLPVDDLKFPIVLKPEPTSPYEAYCTLFDPLFKNGDQGIPAQDVLAAGIPSKDDLPENLSSALSQPSLGVFEVLVHPSHVELNGPIEPSENSVFDYNRDIVDHFLRVRFVENGMKTLKAEAGVSLDKIIDRRVIPILRCQSQSLLPFSARLEFLGYTMSGLKRRKAVWLLRSWDPFEDAATIRNRIGAWNVQSNQGLANFPSKWGARLSLAFTESIPIARLSKDEWEVRDDVPADSKFPNTDGCGIITPEFCDSINHELQRHGMKVSTLHLQPIFALSR